MGSFDQGDGAGQIDVSMAGRCRLYDGAIATFRQSPALKAPPPIRQRVVLPLQSLKHPLSVYDALLEGV